MVFPPSLFLFNLKGKKRQEKGLNSSRVCGQLGGRNRLGGSPAFAGNTQKFHFEMMKLENPRLIWLMANGK